MPSEHSKILEFNQYEKSNKAPFTIYADLKCITEKTDGFKNNPEEQFKNDLRTIKSFRSIKNKHGVHRGKDCMKKFCQSLREHAMNIVI